MDGEQTNENYLLHPQDCLQTVALFFPEILWTYMMKVSGTYMMKVSGTYMMKVFLETCHAY